LVNLVEVSRVSGEFRMVKGSIFEFGRLLKFLPSGAIAPTKLGSQVRARRSEMGIAGVQGPQKRTENSHKQARRCELGCAKAEAGLVTMERRCGRHLVGADTHLCVGDRRCDNVHRIGEKCAEAVAQKRLKILQVRNLWTVYKNRGVRDFLIFGHSKHGLRRFLSEKSWGILR